MYQWLLLSSVLQGKEQYFCWHFKRPKSQANGFDDKGMIVIVIGLALCPIFSLQIIFIEFEDIDISICICSHSKMDYNGYFLNLT